MSFGSDNSVVHTLKNKRIFISPIDWGLGHASRCIQLISHLKESNFVLIGSTSQNTFLFKHYFPDLPQLTVPSYGVKYSNSIPLGLKLFLQWPRIQLAIKKENKQLKKIVFENRIDFVISDNRFGLFSKTIPSVFVTHQLNIQVPVFGKLINSINRKYIHHFTEVWVPDYFENEKRLSGVLSDSDKITIPVHYIGPQSALTLLSSQSSVKTTDVLILLSGIEPLRTDLERSLVNICNKSDLTVILVRGTNDLPELKSSNLKIINFSFGEELKSLLVNAKTVICRSGYSTLMDVHLLNKKNLILIPTPGQYEQEYLAKLWHKKFGVQVIHQNHLEKEFKIH